MFLRFKIRKFVFCWNEISVVLSSPLLFFSFVPTCMVFLWRIFHLLLIRFSWNILEMSGIQLNRLSPTDSSLGIGPMKSHSVEDVDNFLRSSRTFSAYLALCTWRARSTVYVPMLPFISYDTLLASYPSIRNPWRSIGNGSGGR